MAPKFAKIDGKSSTAIRSITYIRDMLGQLRQIAEEEHADMLCYLIEMAYVEAGDLQVGLLQSASVQSQRH
ncbi:hypothetical protein [Rhizobium sp. RAF56]|jgi:hypothetical protein|uniref:hypothetical protein n=1 Tax=Rhizobium sp. RAF56 TaxID=3233062 RepID=UPI003F9984CC